MLMSYFGIKQKIGRDWSPFLFDLQQLRRSHGSEREESRARASMPNGPLLTRDNPRIYTVNLNYL